MKSKLQEVMLSVDTNNIRFDDNFSFRIKDRDILEPFRDNSIHSFCMEDVFSKEAENAKRDYSPPSYSISITVEDKMADIVGLANSVLPFGSSRIIVRKDKLYRWVKNDCLFSELILGNCLHQ